MIPSQCHFVFHLINHLLCSDQRPCAVLVILLSQLTKKTQLKQQKTNQKLAGMSNGRAVH